mmetsp:Transcript_14837/g.22823  ORF Transcript_14837/g.22823 Transcript_14837/m.22823 type:complete len:998 (+) Transcript_14837:127-3120(+)
MACGKTHSDLLPTKESRFGLYFLLEKAVYRRIRVLHHLQDPATTPGFLSSKKQQNPIAFEESCRGRQISYYRQTSLPLFAAALHLRALEDLQTTQSSSSGISPDELVTCLTLLLSNVILLSKGHYDSRIRSVVKEAVVPILIDLSTEEEPIVTASKNSTVTTSSQTFVNCNGDLDDNLPSPTALYTLTEEVVKKSATSNKSKKKKKSFVPDEKDGDQEDWHNSKIELQSTPLQIARQRFEAMEKVIATDILHTLLSEQQKQQQEKEDKETKDTKLGTDKSSTPIKSQVWVRGLQIGTVSLFVGGLFAVTGGLAAPGLVAAISAFGVASAIPAFATLTHTAALASMFGVVGGGLAAYKMKKRTDGLSEWRIRKESATQRDGNECHATLRGLHAVVCVSGWLHAAQDFQQPWGIQSNDPHLDDDVQLLQKFFSVFAPQKIPFCKPLLQSHSNSNEKSKKKKTAEEIIWHRLEEKYGRNPKHLLPLDKSQMESSLKREVLEEIDSFLQQVVLNQALKMEEIHIQNSTLLQMESMNAEVFANLDLETLEAMQELKVESKTKIVGCIQNEESKQNTMNGTKHHNLITENNTREENSLENNVCKAAANREGELHLSNEPIARMKQLGEEQSIKNNAAMFYAAEKKQLLRHNIEEKELFAIATMSNSKGEGEEERSQETSSTASSSCSEGEGDKESIEIGVQNKNHSHIIWDWEAHYGGELYTVTWESERLLQLCRVVEVLFREISEQIKKEILKQTIIGGMVSAVSLPSTLSTCTAVIDDPYQIISFRSEKAGLELARCLLDSEEKRPVSLVGFSFGARVIFSALLELAKHQVKWEKQQQLLLSSLPKSEKGGEKNKEHLFFAGDPPSWKRSKNASTRGSTHKNRQRRGEASGMTYKREPASLVEDVVLIGMPSIINSREWIQCKEIVAGRLVNCYNKSDWVLSYMINIRCWNAFVNTCGTHSIEVEGVENYEVSHLCSSHSRYPLVVPQILHHIKFGTPQCS